MRIRPATHADTARLAELSEQWAGEGITIGQQPDSRAWFEAAVGPYLLVAENDAENDAKNDAASDVDSDAERNAASDGENDAEDGGEIVGYVQGEELISDESHSSVLPAGTRYLEITNVYVIPPLRSSGIGGALLDELLDRAAQRGIERSMVYSAASELERVIAFYCSHGFRGWFVQLVR